MFENEEKKQKEPIKELKMSEKSGFNKDIDKNEFIKSLCLNCSSIGGYIIVLYSKEIFK